MSSPAVAHRQGSAPVAPLHPFGHSHVTWRGVVQQVRTLVTRSPLVTATVALAAGAGLLYLYTADQAARRARRERRRALRHVKTNFSDHRLEILKYLFESPANHFTLAQLETIFAAFRELLTDKSRGVIPLSQVVQLYHAAGLRDEKVAFACAKFFGQPRTTSR